MYKEQQERLVAQMALGLTAAQATSIVARAYGYETIDLGVDQLINPLNGLMKIRTPVEIKAIPDRALQMLEFVRNEPKHGLAWSAGHPVRSPARNPDRYHVGIFKLRCAQDVCSQ
jgi:hypothetical protein